MELEGPQPLQVILLRKVYKYKYKGEKRRRK
jgi:hypothetical protein